MNFESLALRTYESLYTIYLLMASYYADIYTHIVADNNNRVIVYVYVDIHNFKGYGCLQLYHSNSNSKI